MLIAVSSISGSPGVSSWSLLLSAAWPGDDDRNRVLVETDSSGAVLAVRYGMSPTPGIVELISNVRQGVGLTETLKASAHRLDDKLWAVPAPSSADAAWPILVRMGELGPVLSAGKDIWVVDCGRWWPSAPSVGITSAADLNLVFVDAQDSSFLSVRSRVHHFRETSAVGVVVVGSTQRKIEELEANFGADMVWNIPYIKQLDILAGQAATSNTSKRSKSRRSKAWREALKLSSELQSMLAASSTKPAQGVQDPRPTASKPLANSRVEAASPLPKASQPGSSPTDLGPPSIPVEASAPALADLPPPSIPVEAPAPALADLPPSIPAEASAPAGVVSPPSASVETPAGVVSPPSAAVPANVDSPPQAPPNKVSPPQAQPKDSTTVPPWIPVKPDLPVERTEITSTPMPGVPLGSQPPPATAPPGAPAMPPIDALTTVSSEQLAGAQVRATNTAGQQSSIPDSGRAPDQGHPTEGVPGMPPASNAKSPQPSNNGSVGDGPDNVLPTQSAESKKAGTSPANGSHDYFYDAPTLLPTKKSKVSRPKPNSDASGGKPSDGDGS